MSRMSTPRNNLKLFLILLHRTGRVLEDTFFKQAKAKGYVARSAFKLLEIQQKHKVIPPGGQVLDLGCHPGAWLQVGRGRGLGAVRGWLGGNRQPWRPWSVSWQPWAKDVGAAWLQGGVGSQAAVIAW